MTFKLKGKKLKRPFPKHEDYYFQIPIDWKRGLIALLRGYLEIKIFINKKDVKLGVKT